MKISKNDFETYWKSTKPIDRRYWAACCGMPWKKKPEADDVWENVYRMEPNELEELVGNVVEFTKKKNDDCAAVYIDIDLVKTDPTRFQNREDPFSVTSAEAVEKYYDKNKFDPIVVWNDPKNNQLYVLSGHSRYEGMKRRGAKEIAVRFFDGDEEQAIQFAKVEANRAVTPETLYEDIKAYKLMRDGDPVRDIKPAPKKELKRIFKDRIHKLEDLSYLNPNGLFLQYLDYHDKTAFPRIETYARMIGSLRKKMKDEFTDTYETDCFWFMYGDDNYSNTKLYADEFEELIKKRILWAKSKNSDRLFPECDPNKKWHCEKVSEDLEMLFKTKKEKEFFNEIEKKKNTIDALKDRLNSKDPIFKVHTEEEKDALKSLIEQLQEEFDNLVRELNLYEKYSEGPKLFGLFDENDDEEDEFDGLLGRKKRITQNTYLPFFETQRQFFPEKKKEADAETIYEKKKEADAETIFDEPSQTFESKETEYALENDLETYLKNAEIDLYQLKSDLDDLSSNYTVIFRPDLNSYDISFFLSGKILKNKSETRVEVYDSNMNIVAIYEKNENGWTINEITYKSIKAVEFNLQKLKEYVKNNEERLRKLPIVQEKTEKINVKDEKVLEKILSFLKKEKLIGPPFIPKEQVQYILDGKSDNDKYLVRFDDRDDKKLFKSKEIRDAFFVRRRDGYWTPRAFFGIGLDNPNVENAEYRTKNISELAVEKILEKIKILKTIKEREDEKIQKRILRDERILKSRGGSYRERRSDLTNKIYRDFYRKLDPLDNSGFSEYHLKSDFLDVDFFAKKHE